MKRFLLIIFLSVQVILFNVVVWAQDGAMKMTSPSFKQNGMIPERFTCQGEDVSPQLDFTGVPENAVTLVLIMDDPDAPSGTWVHWVLYDIPVVEKIEEGASIGTPGKNSFRTIEYGGPCPPSGTHRYFFKLYALDSELRLERGMTKAQVEDAMKGHVLEACELVGLFSKKN